MDYALPWFFASFCAISLDQKPKNFRNWNALEKGIHWKAIEMLLLIKKKRHIFIAKRKTASNPNMIS